MRKKKKDLEAYENEMINISNKEKEILESYNEEFVEYNEKVNYEDEEFDYKEEVIKEEITKETENVEEIKYVNEKEENIETKEPKKKSKYSALINLVFTIVISILAMIAIDVVSVARYNSGPFFAIPIKEYDDGGTKEYLGFGYRVIDYNQIQGRKDKEIGTLGLKYNIEPINLQDIDLAIEFVDNEEETYILNVVGIYSTSTTTSNDVMQGFSPSSDPANKIYMSYAAIKVISITFAEED